MKKLQDAGICGIAVGVEADLGIFAPRIAGGQVFQATRYGLVHLAHYVICNVRNDGWPLDCYSCIQRLKVLEFSAMSIPDFLDCGAIADVYPIHQEVDGEMAHCIQRAADFACEIHIGLRAWISLGLYVLRTQLHFQLRGLRL
ncbi:hypothetical protein AB0892_25795 [Streptomyces sp. NPDC005409]|uniref:hypothetical protein n=1 Tax=Streptomyces sp. NPDC005409 TaxID=3155342 RepID=UPI003451B85C